MNDGNDDNDDNDDNDGNDDNGRQRSDTRRRRRRASLAIVGLLAGSLAIARAQQAQATGVISGVVVDGSTGAPVPGAVVFIAAVPARPIGPQTRQVADERGRFAFVNLPADTEYTIAASKFGYLEGGYGRDIRPTDPLRMIALAPDAWVQNIRTTVWKPGVISGTVRDETGEPVAGVYVRALAKHNVYGRSELVSGPIVVTDDRGQFRFSSLGAGEYLVQVPSVQATVPVNTPLSTNRNAPEGAVDVDGNHRVVLSRYPVPPPPVSGRQMTYTVTFHPSTPLVEQAAVLDLKTAEDRANVDITLTPVPTARVSGVVSGPAEALGALTLRLLPIGLENLGLGTEIATAFVRPDGSFTFLNVPAGRYVIDAPNTVTELTAIDGWASVIGTRLPEPPTSAGSGQSSDAIALLPGVSYSRRSFRGSSAYSARTPVTVAGTDVTGVALRLQPHASMTGRVVVEADPARPQVTPPARFPLRLDPAGGEAYLGTPDRQFNEQTQMFSINDIVPGRYFIRAYGYPGWLVKSVTVRGRDVTFTPFEAAAGDAIPDVVVTVTNNVPQLSGAVRDGDSVKTDSAIVVLFPAERGQWTSGGLWPQRLKTVPLSNTGTYSVTTAPAGDYLIAAIDRAQAAGAMDAAFLARLERVATRVTLTWGGKSSQDLTVTVVR